MPNIEKIINVVDAICDCLPIISTITNGAQLVYKSARRVDAAANPVNPTWKDDLKIHFINKSRFECWLGMIPVIGNLTNLVCFIMDGLRDQLMNAVVNSRAEAVKLHLARHPLDGNERAGQILRQAAHSSKPEVFKLILDSGSWNIDTIFEALQGCWGPNDSREANANHILEYIETSIEKSQIKQEHIGGIIYILKGLVEAKKNATANRILAIVPDCDFKEFKEILKDRAFISYSPFDRNKGVLTLDQIKGIIERCNKCSLENLVEYCKAIMSKANTLEDDIKRNNDFQKKYGDSPKEDQLDVYEILNDFYKVHIEIIQKLFGIVSDFDTKILINGLSSASNQGNTRLLEILLQQFEDKLSTDDILRVLKSIHENIFLPKKDVHLEGFRYLLDKYKKKFTKEQCIELRNHFSDEGAGILKIIDEFYPDIKN